MTTGSLPVAENNRLDRLFSFFYKASTSIRSSKSACRPMHYGIYVISHDSYVFNFI